MQRDRALRICSILSFPLTILAALSAGGICGIQVANALYQLSGHMVTSHAREVRALFQDDD